MNLYNKSYLDRIAREKGFIRDNLEKVVRLAEILRYFNQSQLLHNMLALKGGTAINLTVFQMPRLSVDIDLDFSQDFDRGGMIEARQKVNSEIQAFMGAGGYVTKPASKSPHALDSWVFGYTNAGGNQDNIKIEINYSNRQHVLPIEERCISIDFLGDIKVLTLSPIELFASKINALINRAAVRDVYDVYGMIKAGLFTTEEETKLLRQILVFYLAVGSSCKAEEVTLDFPEFRQIEGLSFAQVRTQLLPVLNRNEKFDFNNVKIEVTKFLKDFIHFSSDEQRFIAYFNHREYRPEILFGNGELSSRLALHPMALWKCRPR